MTESRIPKSITKSEDFMISNSEKVEVARLNGILHIIKILDCKIVKRG